MTPATIRDRLTTASHAEAITLLALVQAGNHERTMTGITLNVTHTDIAEGRLGCGDSCALALAARRSFPAARTILVGGAWLIVDNTEYDLPEDAVEFIERFDKGLSVVPFEFTLGYSYPIRG